MRAALRIPSTCLFALLFATGCNREAEPPRLASIDRTAHAAQWDEWKAKRLAALRTPGRPPSYSGLTWMRQGANTIGADSSSDIVLSGTGVPGRLGTLIREGFAVRFEPASGVEAMVDSLPAASGALRSDADSGGASRVVVGSAGFRVIRRVDSLGVRSWDAERHSLKEFHARGLEYFPLDSAWRIPARLVPLETPRRVPVLTEAGVEEEYEIVGMVHAEIGDSTYQLLAYAGNGPTDLFIVLADATSGKETYGFRFLHAARDTATNIVTLDLNYAYNPDCTFTPFSTCPFPPKENRIRASVRAGEKTYSDARLTSEDGRR